MAVINGLDPNWMNISNAIQILEAPLNPNFTPDQAAQLWAANILQTIATNYTDANFQEDFYNFIRSWVNPV